MHQEYISKQKWEIIWLRMLLATTMTSRNTNSDLLFPTLIIQGESTKTKNIFFVEYKKNIINIPYKSKYQFKFQSVNENLLLDQCEILQSKPVNTE